MGRNNYPNQRSQLPKQRGEHFASFGFKHELDTKNHKLYLFLEALSTYFESREEQGKQIARVADPSKMSLKVVERNSVSKASRRKRQKVTKSDIGHIKHEVRQGMSKIGIHASGLTVVFDRIVAVGGPVRGERGKFALAPALDQEATEKLIAVNGICTTAMMKRGIPPISYPDPEWVPHLTAVAARDFPRTVGKKTEAIFNEGLEAVRDEMGEIDDDIYRTGGFNPLEVQFRPLAFYDDETELIVPE